MDINSPEWDYPPNQTQYTNLKDRLESINHRCVRYESMLQEAIDSNPTKEELAIYRIALGMILSIKKDVNPT